MATEHSNNQIPNPTESVDEEMSLLDVLIVLAKHKRIVLGLPLFASIVAGGITLLLPNVFTATTRIMPPQQSQAVTAAALNALGGLAGSAGASLSAAIGLRNPNDLYVGMLRSDSVADQIIERFQLKKRFKVDSQIEARKALEEVTQITAGKDGLIAIEVDDEDPRSAANIANAYVEELDRLTQRLAVTEASQRRLFFERELKVTKENLAEAEAKLRLTQETTGLIQPQDQARAIFDAFADVRARIAAKEMELASMRTFTTDNNPDYVRAQQELRSLQLQLAKLETTPAKENRGNILVPTTRVPEAGLEYLRRVRDVKYHETLFEFLSKQYELAKIDEAKDAGLIQVVDKAIPPDRRSKPKRTLVVLLSAVAAGMIAILFAFIRESLERNRSIPEQARRFDLLRAYLRRWA